MRSESPSGNAQSFTLWQQATIEITRHDHFIIALFVPQIYGVMFRAHPVRGESHIQRNSKREVATVPTQLKMNLKSGIIK